MWTSPISTSSTQALVKGSKSIAETEKTPVIARSLIKEFWRRNLSTSKATFLYVAKFEPKPKATLANVTQLCEMQKHTTWQVMQHKKTLVIARFLTKEFISLS
jgi:hypothetical protein